VKFSEYNWNAMPDKAGHFGVYGGRFVAETLMEPIYELEQAYEKLKNDPAFQAEFDRDLKYYVGRPSPLYLAGTLDTRTWRCKNLPQARRPEPHRRTQDQQHHRSSLARQTHGQEAHYR
jgi:Tryptophan synthase beta chain